MQENINKMQLEKASTTWFTQLFLKVLNREYFSHGLCLHGIVWSLNPSPRNGLTLPGILDV